MKAVVVLGGGGAKAIAHAGVWKALEEEGVEVVHIVGTSMGAVMGAAFAAGQTADAVLGVAGSLVAKDVASLDVLALLRGVFAQSILKRSALEATIARFVPADRFGQLAIPLTVTATDLDSGELILFGPDANGPDVPLRDALYASCALPLYFVPARINGRRLADGGLRSVLPLRVAAAVSADRVIAVDVGPGFDESVPPDTRPSRAVPALVRAHGEAIRVMMAAQTEREIREWPANACPLVVVRAVAEREATFAVGQSGRYFEAGYRAAKRQLRTVESRA